MTRRGGGADQRRQIRALCQKSGPAFRDINNTPERSIQDAEVYQQVYPTVLDAEQKQRVPEM